MLGSHVKSEELLRDGDCEHGKTYAEPADLGEADHCAGQPASLLSEAAVCEHVECESALCADEAECSGVDTEDRATEDEGEYEALEVKACSQVLAGPHAC